MPPLLLRFVPAILLTVAGAVVARLLVPGEAQAVREHLLGFPDADAFTHQLRPVALALFCFLPAIGALCYALAGSLDRYLARQMLGAVGLCALPLAIIWVLMDVQHNLDEFQEAEDTTALVLEYYSVAFPSVFVLLVPFALILGLLYGLGKLSNSREIVAMLQTGRGVFRVIMPIATIGLFLSVASLLLNYHWAPWGEGYKEALIDYAKSGSTSQATQVVYQHKNSGRNWYVGRFPYNYTQGEPLRDVIVRTKGGGPDDNLPATVLTAPIASWDKLTRTWTFQDAQFVDLRAQIGDDVTMPLLTKLPSPHVVTGWPETPWQIVKPGLKQEYLGIPELRSWLDQHRDIDWVNRRAYLTRWYYRWSQPWMSLVVVLLATPLGIVFTRRGTAGGVAIAFILGASMLLVAEFSLSLGDAGYIPPILAAWGPNLVFAAIALALLYRRLRGRPIYQSMKKLIPETEG